MYETGEAILFFFVFASQVLLISWLYPRRVLSRTRLVLRNHPPSTHPKMYVQPIEYYERRLRNYARLNHGIAAAGFLIIVGLVLGTFAGQWDGAIGTPWSSSGEWDAAIVTPFFLVQWIGAFYYQLSMLKHNKARAQAALPRVRTTELRRRRLFDFVSPVILIVAVLTNITYIAFVLWYRRFGFDWFTAAGNIAIIALMVVAMAATVAITLRTRPDHYQAHQDRLDLMKLVVNQVVAFSIAFPVVFAIQLIVKLYDPDFLEPVIASLNAQLIALAWLLPAYRYRMDKIDFDVYKRDADDSTGTASATR